MQNRYRERSQARLEEAEAFMKAGEREHARQSCLLSMRTLAALPHREASRYSTVWEDSAEAGFRPLPVGLWVAGVSPYICLMCGKFTQMMSWRKVCDLSDLVGRSQSAPDEPLIGTPMRLCRIIHLDDTGIRANSPMRWGFVDVRAKSPLERPKHMHARAETIDQLPTFADAFTSRRGILLTKTFNVGQELPNGKTVQHAITPRDGKPIAIAVIWEKWENRNEGTLLTFVMVTTPPNPLIATVADRMPAILRPEDWPLWLGEISAQPRQIKEILKTRGGDWDMAEQTPPNRRKMARQSSQPALF